MPAEDRTAVASVFGRGLGAADAFVGRSAERVAGLLVAVEVMVLFAGVVSRYVFGRPLTWSDELASTLFLWLAMFGAAVAVRAGAHMRMTALVMRMPVARRRFFDALAVAAGLAFLALIVGPAIEWAEEERFITTSALEISGVWRAAAFPCGVVLMAFFSLTRLALDARPRDAIAALLVAVAIVVAFRFLGPSLKGLGQLNLLIFFVGGVMVAIFAGVPIGFSFALATFGFLALTTRVPTMVMVGRMDEGMSHLILLSVPLFVFLGLLIEMAGMARAMVAFLASLIGHVRGGLSYVLIAAMYLVSGISGSKAADMAAVAPGLFPEMVKRGAKPGDLAALLAATGAQTETIPPSIVLITIGSVTGVSIAALFTGGMLPGLVLAVGLGLVVALRARGERIAAARASRSEIVRACVVALPALALPFIIRAAVVQGVATATEVSTIGIAYTGLAGIFVYRCFDRRRLLPLLVDTAKLSGAILFIIGAASAMAWGLTQSGFSRTLAAVMTGLPGGAVTFMVVSMVAFVVLGSVLEGIPAIVLFGPLLFPVARAVGIHEVHYAMVVILSMGLGLFAPPFGVGYYTACAIGGVDPNSAIRPILAYLAALICGIALIAAVPWLSTGFL